MSTLPIGIFKGIGKLLAPLVIRTRRAAPLRPVPCGETGVALVVVHHGGQIQPVGQRHGLRIDLPAADDEHLLLDGEACERLLERSGHLDPFGGIVLPARDDDIAPVGERPAERLERLASHHDGMTARELLETFQIFGDMPQQRVTAADNAVLCNGHDHGNHTAMGALIEGHGSYPSRVKSS